MIRELRDQFLLHVGTKRSRLATALRLARKGNDSVVPFLREAVTQCWGGRNVIQALVIIDTPATHSILDSLICEGAEKEYVARELGTASATCCTGFGSVTVMRPRTFFSSTRGARLITAVAPR